MQMIHQFFFPSIITIVAFVSSLLPLSTTHAPQKHMHVSPTATPTATMTPSPTKTQATPAALENNIITAKSTITASGKTIHLSMQYDKNGGEITGAITGDCKGSVAGNFNADKTLAGSAKATCSLGFVALPVQISFAGHLLDSTQAAIHYSVNAAGQEESGDTVLSLQ